MKKTFRCRPIAQSCIAALLNLYCASSVSASCADVNEWLAWGEPILKVLRADAYGGTNKQLAPMYAGPEFVKLAGRPFAAMSDSQRNRLGKQISKCSRDATVRQSVTYPLFVARARPDYGNFLAALHDAASAPDAVASVADQEYSKQAAISAAQQRVAEAKARQAQPKRIVPHRAGDLIADTPTTNVYFYQYDTHADPHNCKSGRSTWVSVVVDADDRDHFVMRDNYISALFEKEILPAVVAVCGSGKEDIYADIYFAGQYLNKRGEDVSRDLIAGGLSPHERFGHVFFQKPEQGDIRVRLTGFRGPFNAANEDLRSFTGFEAQRARGWRSLAQATADENTRQAQIALTGAPIADALTWVILTDDGSNPWLNNRDAIYTRAQAYGQATVRVCAAQTPGGINERLVRAVYDDGREKGRITIRIPTDFGRAAFARGTVGLFSNLEQSVFYDEAEKGPVQDSIAGILERVGCMSNVHRDYHRKLLNLVERHRLK